MLGQTPAAGWYADGAGTHRWWDGTSWTSHVMPQSAAATSLPRQDAGIATSWEEPTDPATAGGASIVPGGVVRTPRSRAGGKEILIGLGLLAAFAVLTVGTAAASAGTGGRVFIGAAGVGALFLLRGLSARYSSNAVVLLGFVGIAALVAGVMLL